MVASARQIKRAAVKQNALMTDVLLRLQNPETVWPHMIASYLQIGKDADQYMESLSLMISFMERFNPDAGLGIINGGVLLGSSYLIDAVESGKVPKKALRLYKKLADTAVGPGQSDRVEDVTGAAQMMDNIKAGGFLNRMSFMDLFVLGTLVLGVISMFMYFWFYMSQEDTPDVFWRLWTEKKTPDKHWTAEKESQGFYESMAETVSANLNAVVSARYEGTDELQVPVTFTPNEPEFENPPGGEGMLSYFGSTVSNFVSSAVQTITGAVSPPPLGGAKEIFATYSRSSTDEPFVSGMRTVKYPRVWDGEVPDAAVQQRIMNKYFEDNSDLSKLDPTSEEYQIMSKIIYYNLMRIMKHAGAGFLQKMGENTILQKNASRIGLVRNRLISGLTAVAGAVWWGIMIKDVYDFATTFGVVEPVSNFFTENYRLADGLEASGNWWTNLGDALPSSLDSLPSVGNQTGVEGLTQWASNLRFFSRAGAGAAAAAAGAAVAAPAAGTVAIVGSVGSFILGAAKFAIKGRSQTLALEARTQRMIGDRKWEIGNKLAPYLFANLRDPFLYLPAPWIAIDEFISPTNDGMLSQEVAAKGTRPKFSSEDTYADPTIRVTTRSPRRVSTRDDRL